MGVSNGGGGGGGGGGGRGALWELNPPYFQAQF